MIKLPFTIEQIEHTGVKDVAYLDPGEDPTDALREAVIHAIQMDIEVTIGDVTMCLDFWTDPTSWQTEWAEKLELGEDEDAVDAVMALLAGAVEES